MNRFFCLATILTLHRIYPSEPGKLFPNENMKVSPEFLENFILEARERGYSFIGLDELHRISGAGESSSKKFIITIDDGYADNYTHAYPIFRKHNVPFALYVTTSFPDRSAVLWWYSLEDLIVQNEELQLGDGSIYRCTTAEEKNATFLSIREKIIALPTADFLTSLNHLFDSYRVDWKQRIDEFALNWEQIREISQDPLATIGNHTVNHPALNRLSEQEIVNEILVSKRRIESQIEKRVEHFCYPFGSQHEVGEREFEIVKRLDMKTATTTRRGSVFYSHRHRLEALPRIMLTHDFSWHRFLWFQVKDALRHQLKIAA